VVDPVGRVVKSLPLGQAGILDGPLPRVVAEPIYARVGDAPAFVIVALALLIVLRRRLAGDGSKI
jgi:apolipoprotein N-acyltransferase